MGVDAKRLVGLCRKAVTPGRRAADLRVTILRAACTAAARAAFAFTPFVQMSVP